MRLECWDPRIRQFPVQLEYSNYQELFASFTWCMLDADAPIGVTHLGAPV